ncbi:MAG: metallophosphoesterase [Nitrososphaeria archaeon]
MKMTTEQLYQSLQRRTVRLETLPETSLKRDRLMRTLILPDVHLPHINKTVVSMLVDEFKNGIDRVVLLGDYLDFDSLSRFFPKKFTGFSSELKESRAALGHLRKKFDDVPLVYIIGNHEERFMKKLGESFSDLADFINLKEILYKSGLIPEHAEMINVKETGQPYLLERGIYAIHGHETTVRSSSTPARSLQLKIGGGFNYLFGHFHTFDLRKTGKNQGRFVYFIGLPMVGSPNLGYVLTNTYESGYAVLDGTELKVVVLNDNNKKQLEMVIDLRQD